MNDNSSPAYMFVGISTRILAHVLDFSFLSVIITTIYIIVINLGFDDQIINIISFSSILFFLLSFTVFSITLWGKTPASFILKYSILRPNGNKLNILLSTIRFILKAFLGLLSFFSIIFSEKKSAIHDLACGSVVVNDKYISDVLQVNKPQKNDDD